MNRPRLAPTLAAALLACATAAAQPAAPPRSAPLFLWDVRTPTNKVSILGSIHLLSREDYPLPAPMELACRNAARAVFETDLAKLAEPSFATAVAARAMFGNGQSLSASVGADLARKAAHRLQPLGLTFEIADRFRPWYAGVLVTVAEAKAMGLDPKRGVDTHFFDAAKAAGKPRLSLEEPIYQIELLAGLPDELQRGFLAQSIEEGDTIRQMLRDLVHAWRAGDAAQLERILCEATEKHPELNERLLYARNRAWADKVQGFLALPGDTLVVVGAAHLVGPDNLLQILAQRGHQAAQVRAPK